MIEKKTFQIFWHIMFTGYSLIYAKSKDSAAISFRSWSTCQKMVLLCEVRIKLWTAQKIGCLITTVGDRKKDLSECLNRIKIEPRFDWLSHYHCWRTERGTNCSDGLEWVSAGAIAKLSNEHGYMKKDKNKIFHSLLAFDVECIKKPEFVLCSVTLSSSWKGFQASSGWIP